VPVRAARVDIFLLPIQGDAILERAARLEVLFRFPAHLTECAIYKRECARATLGIRDHLAHSVPLDIHLLE
jgi:hypothetical protein